MRKEKRGRRKYGLGKERRMDHKKKKSGKGLKSFSYRARQRTVETERNE